MSDSSSVEGVKSVVKAGAEVITEVAKAEQEAQKTYQSALELVRRAGTAAWSISNTTRVSSCPMQAPSSIEEATSWIFPKLVSC
jgi:hypothetical protein